MEVNFITCRVRYVWVPDTRYTGRMPPRFAGATAYGGSRYAAPSPGSAQRSVGAWFKVAPNVIAGTAPAATWREVRALPTAERISELNSGEFGAQGADLVGRQDIEHHQEFFQ